MQFNGLSEGVGLKNPVCSLFKSKFVESLNAKCFMSISLSLLFVLLNIFSGVQRNMFLYNLGIYVTNFHIMCLHQGKKKTMKCSDQLGI